MPEDVQHPQQAEKPAVGSLAPKIEAATATGEPFSLEEQRGRWAVVYFYPRANTPG